MALTATAESQSKRGTILIIVIAVHAIGLWVVESGLSRTIIEMVAPPVETKIIEEEKPPEETPPPPPPPEIPVTPPPFIPPPEVVVQVQVQPNAIQQVTTERPPVVTPPIMTPPAPKPTIPGTTPKVSKKSRSPDEYYPAASNRDNETGSVVIKCYVRLDGRCNETSVAQSSGFDRLDQAAVKYANEGIRFDPGTNNGTAEAMWYSFRVTFKQKTR